MQIVCEPKYGYNSLTDTQSKSDYVRSGDISGDNFGFPLLNFNQQGKPVSAKTDKFSENFRGGGGSFLIQQISLQNV